MELHILELQWWAPDTGAESGPKLPATGRASGCLRYSRRARAGSTCTVWGPNASDVDSVLNDEKLMVWSLLRQQHCIFNCGKMLDTRQRCVCRETSCATC